MCSWAILSCSSVREIALQKSITEVSLCIATDTTLHSCMAESPESIEDNVEAAELVCVETPTCVRRGDNSGGSGCGADGEARSVISNLKFLTTTS
jgi:hypothetical protein